MINRSKLFSPSQRSTWVIAFLTSIVLLGIVIFQTDWKTIIDIWEGITWMLVFVGLILLLMEGVCTSYRMYLYIPGKTKLSSCFRVTAWHVLMLVLLPARLGEVAAIFLLKENFNQKTSPAIMIIVIQRLFDILGLTAFVNSICKCNSIRWHERQAAVASLPFVPARKRGTDETLHTAYRASTLPDLRPDESRTYTNGDSRLDRGA